ncbi:MAG: hypothetical protein KJO29_07375, partial [Bacteroidia bacterium]|nr:hypothetical protein [Bacteroidia bacterium]
MLVCLLIFSACPSDEDDFPPISDVGYITGKVTTLDGQPLTMVSVSLAEMTVLSDVDGYYILDDIPVGENQVISFKMDGFVTNYKRVDVLKDAYALAHAALSPVGIEAQFNVDQETNIDFSGAKVKIPANTIVDGNGSVVSGSFNIKATYFNPTDDNYIDVFPGDFMGESTTGDVGLLESYGFINVELSKDGEALNLAEGSISEISIPVPAELQSIAPTTIPLFFFDEENGIWKEEGSANLINGSYTGTVSHFSNWNADFIYEDQTCTIKGRVVDQNGNPIDFARVVANGVDFSGSNVAFSGSDGRFSMKIKSDSRVVVFAELAIPGVGILIGISPPRIEDTCPPDGMNDIGDLVIELPEQGNVNDVWWDVCSFNTSNLWIVGRNGKIQYSPDYGFSWQAQNSNTMSTILGVHFIDQNTGWACGNNGTLLKTSNGGNNWESVEIPVSGNDLYEVLFLNDLLGWMVGTVGNIWRTENGGLNWNKIQTNFQQDLHDVDFINENFGWAVGNLGKIFHSNDGGLNWNEQASGTSVDLYGVEFISATEGWVVGLNGTVLYTENGGQNWTSQVSQTGEDLLAIDFNLTKTIGVAVGTNGKTIYTRNSGIDWQSQDYGATGTCWDVDLGSTTGVVVGDGFAETFNLPDVYLVTEGWTEVSSPVQKFLTRVKFRTDQEGYILGQGGTILKTVDQGANWNVLNSGSTEYIQDISFTQNSIYVCGDYETLLKSVNGGASWQDFAPSIGIGDYLRIQFIDDQTGWVIESDSYQGIDRLLY